jgi:RNA polymerase sigma factor FliA
VKTYIIGGQEYSREEVIHRYLHLVKFVAGRISVNLPPNVELSDLINDGVLGLIDAIEKYDDGRGVKFETYAITRIHGAILDALRALDWVPRAVRQRVREFERASHELEAEYGRAPTTGEIAQRMGISAKDFDVVLQTVRGVSLLSLEDRLPNERGEDIALRDTIKDLEGDVTVSVEKREVRSRLLDAIGRLPPQEQTVIRCYYFEGKTLKDVKSQLGVSGSRVSQIHAQAVVRLRKLLRELRQDLGYREGDALVRQKYTRKPQPEPVR